MNLEQILQDLGVKFVRGGEHRHVNAGWVGVDCPWCGKGSGKYHLGFRVGDGFCTCWRCGPKRKVEAVVEISGRPFNEVLRAFRGMDPGPAAAPRPRGKLCLPAHAGPLLAPHRRYLTGRGFNPDELATRWGLQGIGVAARLAWRILIPIRLGDEVVSWTTRGIAEDQQRYVSASSREETYPAKHLLYGEEMVRGHSVLVVEGPADVWAWGPGAVATLGVVATKQQVLRIAAYPVRVVCYDADAAGRRRADRLASELAVFPGETYNARLETGKDLAGADRSEYVLLKRLLVGN